ncbi:hypothetical protein TpMuguga_03g00232 [Theileria parva strain Muguga]|uniref:Uncharacterized protein n=1 Tax=Theileria parva TaxID=5875 RepID=Q4N0B7_THEPA|nr:uncharacterized protein TpMuguga_03g00232 [Theileria parva strain Muguga]EAN30967.1 hypothetical protein TpMuguga_03g00232 [Theileria parva strain Muguga]|eukprot:XP_763250.1 hypothetical protein [Theileria parva strain Muguga]
MEDLNVSQHQVNLRQDIGIKFIEISTEHFLNTSHMSQDIENLGLKNTGKQYDNPKLSSKLCEWMIKIIFEYDCGKVNVNGKLCCSLINLQEFIKYLLLYSRDKQMYIKFNVPKFLMLDLENLQQDSVLQPKIPQKRLMGSNPGILEKIKRLCNSNPNAVQTTNEPTIQVVTNLSSRLLDRGVSGLSEVSSVEPHQSCSIPQGTPIGSSYSPGRVIRSDKLISSNGYYMYAYGVNYSYKLTETPGGGTDSSTSSGSSTTTAADGSEIIGHPPPKTIEYYKMEHMTVFGKDKEFVVCKLVNDEYTEHHHEIPPIRFYRRVNGKFILIRPKHYEIQLRIVGEMQMVFRLNDESECVKVMFGDEIVWVNPPNSKSFVVTLLYNLTDYSIVLETNVLIKCTKVNNQWVNKTQRPFYVRHYADDAMGDFIPVYIENVTKTNSKHKYTLDYRGVPNIELVKYYDKIIWKREPDQAFPKTMICSTFRHTTFSFKFDDKPTVSHS